jgi:hypothetical protein
MTDDPEAARSHRSATAADEQNHTSNAADATPPTPKKPFGFYAIIVALALTNLLTSLEQTITSTALPTITADLGGASLYVWVVNGYYLTQYARHLLRLSALTMA